MLSGSSSRERCMSENTVNGALRRLGWSGSEMTGHGFRSMASWPLTSDPGVRRRLGHEPDPIKIGVSLTVADPDR